MRAAPHGRERRTRHGRHHLHVADGPQCAVPLRPGHRGLESCVVFSAAGRHLSVQLRISSLVRVVIPAELFLTLVDEFCSADYCGEVVGEIDYSIRVVIARAGKQHGTREDTQ